MDPVRMKASTAAETRDTLLALLEEHGEPLDLVAININNIDYGTPDECIRAVFSTLEEKRGGPSEEVRAAYERW